MNREPVRSTSGGVAGEIATRLQYPLSGGPQQAYQTLITQLSCQYSVAGDRAQIAIHEHHVGSGLHGNACQQAHLMRSGYVKSNNAVISYHYAAPRLC
ncbi:hypothetical protein [Rhizobium sp. AC44/96]|uniref:hypothetical protein n=1 Tax=Rhizobium sp. AC44/96 TaxID=1841654 RepID=UPI0011473406|nr:hypothetical protein [Rhizobium sp. AC44/96]